MSTRDSYPAGVPCWVETLQPDPRAALDFYGPLFGWEFSEPGPMAGTAGGEYFVARIEGRDVAGLGALPDRGGPPAAAWSTSISVDNADAAVERATSAGGSLLLGPLDALPAGRLAVLADPTGAPFAVWEAHDRAGAQLVNQPGTWAMSSLHTPDPASASAFYGAAFDWQFEPIVSGAPIMLFRLPNYVGGEPGQPIPRDVVGVMTPIEPGPDAPAIPPHWNVNLHVHDADAVGAHAVELGGTILMAPMDTPGFRSAVVLDPQGAAFSISHVVPSG
ncbi:MAG: VOC family protein [Actinomycetota bacterium]|nr:VOC family protein [Actinomycetota bacterium]